MDELYSAISDNSIFIESISNTFFSDNEYDEEKFIIVWNKLGAFHTQILSTKNYNAVDAEYVRRCRLAVFNKKSLTTKSIETLNKIKSKYS